MPSKRKRPRDREDAANAHPSSREPQDRATTRDDIAAIERRHMRFGWWSLLVFVSMGLFLESLHGFKVGWYLDVSSTTRRHLWTLAHAHGTLFALLNLVFGGTLHRFPSWSRRTLTLASACLFVAALLLPTGFFLGGIDPQEGDPGLGVVLVPIGGVFLLIAVFLAARSWSGRASR